MDQYNQDDIIRAQIISDTMWCARYFFKSRFNRKFVTNWHHQLICGVLDLVYEGKIKKLAIRMPPRYGKTELAVKNFVAKGLAINPASKFIHLSYSGDLALDNSEEIRDFICEPEYARLFPYVRLSKGSTAKHKWYLTEGGGVYATSTGGQITGFGAGAVDEEDEIPDDAFAEDPTVRFAGAIVIDDALKPDDAESDTAREKVNNRFETTIRSRANSRNTPVIVIGQALHERDLIGYLIETEPMEWTVLTIPAISTLAELKKLLDTWREFGVHLDFDLPDADPEEEIPLWNFKHTLAELHKLRDADKRVFESQYQQNPKDELGKLLPISALKFTPRTDDGWITNLAFGDPADGGGDCLTVSFVDIYFRNNRFMARVASVVHTQDGIEASFASIDDKLIEHKTEQFFVEENGVGRAFMIFAKMTMTAQTKLMPYPESMNKEAKIISYYEFVGSHFEFNETYKQDRQYTLFIDHLTKYSREGTNTHRKDAMDNLCSAAKILKVKYRELIYQK